MIEARILEVLRSHKELGNAKVVVTTEADGQRIVEIFASRAQAPSK